MTDDKNLEALHNINKRFVSDDPSNSLPAVTLPDGTKVQTGTVGALIQNIKLYDRICAGQTTEGEFAIWAPHQSASALTRVSMTKAGLTKQQVEEMLTVPIPTLKNVGLFDIFSPEEWMNGISEGRAFIGKKAKEMGY